jgi:hypothetical protein
MQPFLTMHVLGEARKSLLGILHRPILPEIDFLGFEGFHEALTREGPQITYTE